MTALKIEGLDDIRRALRNVPDRVQKDVVGSGTQTLATAVRKEAQAKARAHGGGLARLAAFMAVRKARGRNARVVGYLKPFSNLAHLFEFGTQERFQKKTGKSVGRMAPQPHMRPAVEAMSAGRAEQLFVKGAKRRFERAMRKLAR